MRMRKGNDPAGMCVEISAATEMLPFTGDYVCACVWCVRVLLILLCRFYARR